jgi:hypothetical protein
MRELKMKQRLTMCTTLGLLAGLLMGGQVFAAATAAEKTSRDLTVEQNVIYTVQPEVVIPTALQVTASVDHVDNIYGIGEKVRIFVQTNKDAYVTVLNVGASGQTIQLLPNQYQTNNFVKANTLTEIPAPNSGASITAFGPAGVELIKVIASTAKTNFFSTTGTIAVGPFKSIKGGSRAAARDLQVTLNPGSNPNANFEWDDFNKIIHTVVARPVVPLVPVPMPGVSALIPVAPIPPVVAIPPNPFVMSFPPYSNVSVIPAASLKIATDKNSYRVGENIQVAVTSDKTCYLTLINYQTNGQMVALFPNQVQTNNQIQAGQTLLFPGNNTGLTLQPKGPAGIENLVAVCNTQNTPVTPSFANKTVAVRDLALVVNQLTNQSAQAMLGFFVTQ